ncbi:hypothetical protein E0485_13365 [Paenibacillus albiflavus]|uniref:DUF6199 domain-containing protein n=1 Tax=Paenibacillus albiflavus TaxID=2545760 RepID=A0A4R4EB91_9BACL|nr:DUF6199 family natural product biosynthesis protein [Paenibacillus albiflavus]TCZ76577.1 hypothetical protein E0485_13365 [Paenibacillus albiflavus]
MLIIFLLIVIIFGIINIFSPQAGWYLTIGWKFKDAEPSDAALFVQRLSGIIGSIIAIIVLISTISSSIHESNWPAKFKERMQPALIAEMHTRDYSYSNDEIARIVELIKQSNITRNGPQDYSFGYNASLEIKFIDGSSETIYVMSGLEIQPWGVDVKYRFENSELSRLIIAKGSIE